MKKILFLVLPAFFIFFSFNDVHAETVNFSSQNVYLAWCDTNGEQCGGTGINVPGLMYSPVAFNQYFYMGDYHFQGDIELNPSYQYNITVNFNPVVANLDESKWKLIPTTLKIYNGSTEIPFLYSTVNVTHPANTGWVSYHITFVPAAYATHFSFRVNPPNDVKTGLVFSFLNSGALIGDFGAILAERTIYSTTDQKLDNINQAIIGSSSAITGAIGDLKNQQQQTNEKLDDINNFINDSSIDSSQNEANNFFKDFEDDDYGLSDIVKMPLQFINSLTTTSCSALVVPMPFVNQNLTLPCMTTIYETYFGDLFNLYQIISTGYIAYNCCVGIFQMVQGFKDPENDEVKVMDL